MTAVAPDPENQRTHRETDAVRITRSTRANHELSIALAAWNDYVSPERTLRSLRNPVADLAWDKAPNRLPLHPPPEVIRELRATPARRHLRAVG